MAGVLALASAVPLWFGLGIALLNLLVATQRPDPAVPDGDPCCWHPDTWGQVAAGLAFGVGTLIACVALICGAVALGRYATTGKLPNPRGRRRLTTAASLLAVWALMSVLLG